MLFTQSKNSSAKIATFFQDNSVHLYQSSGRKSFNWMQLKRQTFQVTITGFSFYANHFFFQIIDTATKQFSETGLLKELVSRYLRDLKKLNVDNYPKVLLVDDLSFGFVIWLVSCGISIVAFLIEIFMMVSEIYKNHKTSRVCVINKQ